MRKRLNLSKAPLHVDNIWVNDAGRMLIMMTIIMILKKRGDANEDEETVVVLPQSHQLLCVTKAMSGASLSSHTNALLHCYVLYYDALNALQYYARLYCVLFCDARLHNLFTRQCIAVSSTLFHICVGYISHIAV